MERVIYKLTVIKLSLQKTYHFLEGLEEEEEERERGEQRRQHR